MRKKTYSEYTWRAVQVLSAVALYALVFWVLPLTEIIPYWRGVALLHIIAGAIGAYELALYGQQAATIAKYTREAEEARKAAEDKDYTSKEHTLYKYM